MQHKKEDKERFAPLRDKWTLYYSRKDKKKKWEDRMYEMDTLKTFYDFWITADDFRPSDLASNRDYYIFKQGIAPMWEDEANINGGRWLINIGKEEGDWDLLDDYWHTLTKAMVTGRLGTADIADQICGAVVNVRPKGNKIAIWIKDAKDDRMVFKIGHAILNRLKPSAESIRFEVNLDLKTKRSSRIKPKFVLYY